MKYYQKYGRLIATDLTLTDAEILTFDEYERRKQSAIDAAMENIKNNPPETEQDDELTAEEALDIILGGDGA